jgi:beta-phosphoglucomutase
MNLKLVIFDMDGVLVDACEWHRVALNKSLEKLSNYTITKEDHYSTFNGLPTKIKLKKLAEMGRISFDNHAEINNLKQEKTIEIINTMCDVDHSKVELLKWLQDQGIIVACYTNSIRKTTNLMLQKTGIIDFFAKILTNQDVENSKPHPEGYNNILETFNILPEECIIVEDSPKGLEAAYASGCFVMKVVNPSEVIKENIRSYINENFNTNGRSRQ